MQTTDICITLRVYVVCMQMLRRYPSPSLAKRANNAVGSIFLDDLVHAEYAVSPDALPEVSTTRLGIVQHVELLRRVAFRQPLPISPTSSQTHAIHTVQRKAR
jgi:hypothetical protein